ncbi:MAG TPA: IgGFc-binding protein [Polyangia bacterium]|nr:IgGFc-binding protein [Polyangia bacterium]
MSKYFELFATASLLPRSPWLPLSLLAGAVAAGACSGPQHPVGGGDGNAGGRAGGPLCWGDTGCDRNDPRVVLSCQPNAAPEVAPVDAPEVAPEVLEICAEDQICSLGRCVSEACAAAELATGNAGCLFYTAVLDNLDSDDGKPTLIVVANPGQTRTPVYLQQRTDGQTSPPSWEVVQTTWISGGGASSFTVVDHPLEGPGYAAAIARRIASDQPVTVMVIQSDNRDIRASSSAGTMLVPVHALGGRYMVMVYPQSETASIAQLSGARGGAAEVAIVATQSHTTLRILPPGALDGAVPDEQILEEDGDLFQLVTDAEGNDLSGTLISASKPVAVFSGNVATTYGKTANGINTPDMAMEQMVPISEWSKSYVAARLPAESSACDTLFAADTTLGPVSYWRILASQPAMLRFSWTGQLDGLPPDILPVPGGQPLRLVVSGQGDFVVHSDVPILVTQGMDCEATLSSAVPVDAPLGPQTFALAPNFEHEVSIVRKDDHRAPPVLLDGQDISDLFFPVADGFSVARKEFPPCYESVDRCVHRLTGAHGMTLRGMDVTSSYATTPVSWLKCIDACP